MRIIIRILFAALFSFVGLKFLLPHNAYPIEHFEQFLAKILPLSWSMLSIVSRVLVGLIFVLAFLLLFYWERIKWMKYVSILMISIPFIINPVFPKNFEDNTANFDENLPFNLEKNQEETLLVYVSSNCLHCKEALIKLDKAQKKSDKFSNTVVIGYNSKIQNFMDEKQLSFQLDTISPELFLNITKGSFPKFELVKENKILKKWTNGEFNYAVLDNLSKQL